MHETCTICNKNDWPIHHRLGNIACCNYCDKEIERQPAPGPLPIRTKERPLPAEATVIVAYHFDTNSPVEPLPPVKRHMSQYDTAMREAIKSRNAIRRRLASASKRNQLRDAACT